ncbi:MAG: Stp1/IreP family PP2C-type Ser/Thr phosphatase, partial [Anaerolineae bacterium]
LTGQQAFGNAAPVASAPPTQPAQTAQRPRPATSQRSLKPLPLGNFQQRYQILNASALTYSIYYDAVDLLCSHCKTTHAAHPRDGLCPQCGQPLDAVLIHEHSTPPDSSLSPQRVQALLQTGRAGHPHILFHRAILPFRQSTYTIANHPGRWGVLVRGRRPRPSDEALVMVAEVAQSMTYLHQQRLTLTAPGTFDQNSLLESFVVYPGSGEVKLADLSICSAFREDARQPRVSSDIAFLAQLLLFLTTDISKLPGDVTRSPAALRPLIQQAMQGGYETPRVFLTDLSTAPAPATQGRALKPTHGQASHPGHKHSRNEDAIVTFTFDKQQQGESVPIGFYLVADGMGGHDAGDVASQTVNQVVTEWVLKTKVLPDLQKSTRKLTTDTVTEEMLQQAIQAANEALFRHAEATGSNLGSTVTAALIIGNVATVINVGDSRTYLLRNGRLQQITQDHSLVARLLDANVIKPEDVRSHPQRNQIYRSLGQKKMVEVDTFTVPLRQGDRLLLCCDGLWEMVLDDEIQRIVEKARTPQQACEALVEAANHAGGEDNISVILVEME